MSTRTGQARCLLVAGLALATTSCTLPYYWQAATGHLDLVRRRVPIASVLEDPAQPDDVKQTLRRVVDMRRFAVDVLGLPDNDSYSSYAELERPYVVWNVIATQEFSVDPQQWCFPFVGCVSYRGYFSRERAEAFAASLQRDGLDIYVAGASAYSTLGYFADPVLNTMLAGGEAYIAGVLFHELAHQKFYLRGDSELNEAFATAVQQYGTNAWLAQNGSTEALAAYRRRLDRQAGFSELIAAQRARLAALYATDATPEQMRAAKAQAFAQMREEYAGRKDAWGGVSDYDNWFSQPLNNAQLASVSTYRRWLPGLIAFIDRHGLGALYTEMAALTDLKPTERERRLQAMLADAALAGR